MSQRAWVAVGVLVGLVLIGVVGYFAFRQPPQMGTDAEVFRTVDALYTAVTARDEKLLTQCEQRLNALRSAGKLPTAPAEHLDGIIATARSGRWQPAAERLYAFMSAQRRGN